ncbi:MAG: tetratricopeptide repeat protein, partial [bacterium]
MKLFPSHHNIRWWGAVIILAVLVRVVYWWSVHLQPWFQAPGMDPEFYSDWAKDILEGRGERYLPFPRGPLYPYLLAAIFSFSDHWLLPRIFNLMCDIGTILLLGRLGNRWLGAKGSLWAGGLWAINGMAIYFSGEILGTSLEVFLALLTLLSAISVRSNNPLSPIGLGVCWALFSLARPTALVWLPLLAGWIVYQGVQSKKEWIRPLGGFVFSVFIVLSPVTIVNYAASGAFIPISTLGGVNFYIGNSPASRGFSSFLPGVGAGWSEEQAKQFAEQTAGRKLNPGEVSHQFVKLTIRNILQDPYQWFQLMIRKFFYLVSSQEIGNNRPLQLVWEVVPWLRVLAGLVGIGFLLPLALIGFKTLYSQDKESAYLLGGAELSYGFALSLFFIASRYRMPLIPIIIFLAVLGGKTVLEELKVSLNASPSLKRWRGGLKMKFLVLFIGWAVTLPPWMSATGHPAQAPYIQGNAYLRLGQPEKAIPYYLKAAQIDPYFLRLPINLGVAYLESGDTVRADSLFHIAALVPDMRGEALNNLGTIWEGKGERDKALEFYRQAFRYASDNPDVRWNLARLIMIKGDTLALSGQFDEAFQKYQEA